MNTRRQPLLVRDAPKECLELLLLFLAQGGAKCCAVLSRNTTNSFKCLAALLRYMQRVAPPVFGAVTPLDKSPLLKLVHKNDKTARQNPQRRAEFALTQTRMSPQ